MGRWPEVGLLLAHRLRCWHNSKPTLANVSCLLGCTFKFFGCIYNSKGPVVLIAISPFTRWFLTLSSLGLPLSSSSTTSRELRLVVDEDDLM